MTSIYLVEDEIYAMKALQQKIIDLNEDYCIVGTADNGAAALEQITALRPDIVLTDIRMPDMDGLQLIAELQKNGCPSIPIIISGYQAFEYAQQALKLGASDYLLKPINPPELQACLHSCVEKLQKKRKNIISFLIGDETMSFENTMGQEFFTLLYIIIANPLSSVENPLHPNVRYISNTVVEQLFHQFHSCQYCHCFDGFFSNEKVLLLCEDKKNDSFLNRNLQHFLQALQEETHKPVTLYYTTAHRSSLPSAIRECRNSAVRNVIIGESGIYNSIPPLLPAAPNLQETADLFAIMLGQGQLDLLQSNIQRLFQAWSEEHKTYPMMKEDILFIMDTLKRKISSKKYADFSSTDFLENIMSFSRNSAELAENLYLLLLVLFTSSEPENKSGEDLVAELITYFNNNLSSNINLQDLEEKTGFSKVYICRVFKKVKNTTPIDYFTHLKIKKAGQMLTEFPNLSLREISDFLGFNDVYYFSKVFKRITGSSPSEMRAKNE